MSRNTLPSLSFLVLSFLSVSTCSTLNPFGEWKVEGAPHTDEVLTTGDRLPMDKPRIKKFLDFRQPQDWKNRLLEEPISQYGLQKHRLQSPGRTLFHLKSPGKLPGIELGVEMHSIQAFQSVLPSESLAKGFDLRSEQTLLLPPSITVPDYNGGFLRFTW